MIRRLPIVALALCDGFAQETPMEREAAHDVLKKMAALQKTYTVPKVPEPK